jgi:hypothetical protein
MRGLGTRLVTALVTFISPSNMLFGFKLSPWITADGERPHSRASALRGDVATSPASYRR